jgi:uncharacterized protein (DUF1501 family)
MTTLLSSLNHLKMLGAASMYSGPDDYKALICLLLSGGNDSYNMVIPFGAGEHAEYSTVRSNLAIPRNELLSLQNSNNNGRRLGFHPSMLGLRNLYNNGKVAAITNIGTLVEPTNQHQFKNKLVKLPLGLYSHSDQIKHWQTSIPQDRHADGWGGRMADIMSTFNEADSLTMNISLSGNNIFQRGKYISEFVISTDGNISGINDYDGLDPLQQLMTQTVDNMLDHTYQNAFEQTYANLIRKSQDDITLFNAAMENAIQLNTVFSDTSLSTRFKTIARIISAREAISAKRQIFFVNFGGWDHHDGVLEKQAEMLGTVDNALTEFYTATEELGLEDKVTTFTISDFARTLTSNGNGTDHAWGGNTLVVGGAVKGGMYGFYPDLYIGNSLEARNGVLIPTTPTDKYYAELALWFGVSSADLNVILPNLGNFYSLDSFVPPMGFLV